MSIPASFRRVLEAGDPDWGEGRTPSMIIVHGDDRTQSLECYTIRAMDEIYEMIDELPVGSPEQAFLEQVYYGGAMPVTVDDTGRIGLNAKLRAALGVENGSELILVGAGKYFRIWKPETYKEQQVDKVSDWLRQQPKDFDPRSLLQDIQRRRQQGGELGKGE